MGVVYVADQISTGSRRALKIMLPELLDDQELRDRFLREARVCANIPSDHVVQVVASGIEAQTSTPWLAMELLHGEDLAEYIERVGRVSPPGLIEIMRQLCHGLAAAHSVGVVHRDLKPENIFLAVSKRAGAPFTVKVLDFGIAKVIADASAKMTALIGSPLWMAPEQMDPRMSISPATDIWPLCLLAFWLLTGQSYWRSALIKPLSMHSIMREVLFEPLVPASERAAELGVGERIPQGFDAWFARCLVRDVKERMGNAKTALSDLERSLDAGPFGTMPHPPSREKLEAALRAEEKAALKGEGKQRNSVPEPIAPPPESENAPPTLQSHTDPAEMAGVAENEPPSVNIAPAPSIPPPTSTKGTSSDREAGRRSSISVLPLKSSAPLWMVAAGLAALLVAVVIIATQRVEQNPPGTATAHPSAITGAQSAAPTAGSASASARPPAPPTSLETQPPTAPTESGGTKNFDREAATAALKSAAAAVAKDCKRSFGPSGSGTIKVTFGPTGNVSSALLLDPQFAGTLVGTCVANGFLKLHIPPFEGAAVTTNMPFEIPP